MIKKISKPKISDSFTINDIHKIREWKYEIMKDATPEEIKEETKKYVERALEINRRWGLKPKKILGKVSTL